MKELLSHKKIGIWGFGSVGKSILSFLTPFDCQISVLDSRALDPYETLLLQGHDASFVAEDFLPQFLEMNDFIIPSPGIDISKLMETELHKKIITELDLFYAFNTTQTIAITGSAGKTTTVHLLTHLLNKLGKKACAAGNIGLPMLDTIADKNNYDYIVLELSSFQLEHIKTFRSNYAAFLNIYPNHLDRHADIAEYLAAKAKLFAFQNNDDWAFIPLEYTDLLWEAVTHQKIYWIGPDAYHDIIKELSDITCSNNLQIICAIIENLNLPTEKLKKQCSDYILPPDRIEFLGTHKGISFYNDSKATIPESTITAVQKFNKPILFLGGLSKGVDRIHLLKEIQNNVKEVICFGVESEELYKKCTSLSIPASKHATLDAAFLHALECAVSGDVLLLSPAGSSYDLFKNYHERGNFFKKLVHEFASK